MASVTLQVSRFFPAGASVSAYETDSLPSGRPASTAVSTATMAADGTVSFSGLSAGREYVAYCATNGRHVEFTVSAPSPGLSSLSDVAGTPTDGQVLKWVAANQAWEPATLDIPAQQDTTGEVRLTYPPLDPDNPIVVSDTDPRVGYIVYPWAPNTYYPAGCLIQHTATKEIVAVNTAFTSGATPDTGSTGT